MQPKVSMIIPCYNKVSEISDMFDTVIAQEWDNIELILVNDGSTDGTRQIIDEYRPNFERRGYSVLIVDQKNMGLPLAVCEGLKRVTGDFVCQADADDKLDPRYVSIMAEWLQTHPDYDWCACDMAFVRHDNEWVESSFPQGLDIDLKIEKYMFSRIQTSICVYLIRTDYMHRCGVIDYFKVRVGSQEPPIFFPLFMQGGKLKYFDLPLYTAVYLNDNHLSDAVTVKNRYDEALKCFNEWYTPVKHVIAGLPISEKVKNRLQTVCDFARLGRILKYIVNMMEDTEARENALNAVLPQYMDLFKTYFNCKNASYEKTILKFNALRELNSTNINVFVDMLEDIILNTPPIIVPAFSGRLIAWGVLGENARQYLPVLKNTFFEPTEHWDTAGDGMIIKKPNLSAITKDDLVLILPSRPDIVNEIREILNPLGCKTMLIGDIVAYVRTELYPELYNGEIIFSSAATH